MYKTFCRQMVVNCNGPIQLKQNRYFCISIEEKILFQHKVDGENMKITVNIKVIKQHDGKLNTYL